MARRRPARIDGFAYIGRHAYFLTVCTFNRQPWFVNRDCANDTACELLRTAAGYRFAVVAYCLMPDHLHILIEGTHADSDCVKCIAMFKQRSAFTHARKQGGRLCQEGYFEHVVRNEEDCMGISAYIVTNPIRAGLCREVADYPYVGSDRYTIHELSEAIQTLPAWK